MNLHSLRWQVQWGHLMMIAVGMPLVGLVIYLGLREGAVMRADRQLQRFAAATAFDVNLAKTPLEDGLWYALTSDGRLAQRSANAPSDKLLLSWIERGAEGWIDGNRVTMTERPGIPATLIVGMPEQIVFASLTYLPLQLGLLTLLFAGLAMGMGWQSSNRVLSPIERFSQTARRISESAGYEPIDLANTAPELHDLGAVLNDAFKRLDDSLQKQRNLTADASHELRTPVSLLLLELESALRQQRTPEEYRERLAVALDATHHLKKLVDGLLILARSDAGMMQYEMQPTDLEELTLDVIRLLEQKATQKNVRIETNLSPILHPANEESLRQVLLNLIDNAIEYAGANALVRVTLTSDAEAARILVEDNGPGFPEEALPFLFDRFYRVDEARTSREAGHLGLGLAICRTVVEAHAGRIRAGRSEWGGAEFEVSLPAKGAARPYDHQSY